MGRPQGELQRSISSVLKSLALEERPRTRPRIITKYDFMQTRNKKSHLDLPPEFVISTDLHVAHEDGNGKVRNIFILSSHYYYYYCYYYRPRT